MLKIFIFSYETDASKTMWTHSLVAFSATLCNIQTTRPKYSAVLQKFNFESRVRDVGRLSNKDCHYIKNQRTQRTKLLNNSKRSLEVYGVRNCDDQKLCWHVVFNFLVTSMQFRFIRRTALNKKKSHHLSITYAGSSIVRLFDVCFFEHLCANGNLPSEFAWNI